MNTKSAKLAAVNATKYTDPAARRVIPDEFFDEEYFMLDPANTNPANSTADTPSVGCAFSMHRSIAIVFFL